MKYAIMSDAHSNPAALETALRDAREFACGKFVFLGDVTGYGYDVKKTLKLVRDNFDVAILGNHDAVCCGIDTDDLNRMNPHYDLDFAQGRTLGRRDISCLRSLGYTYEEDGFVCSHGDFVKPADWGYILDDHAAAASFRACGRDLLFCGHTHEACVWKQVGKTTEGVLGEKLHLPSSEPESLPVSLEKGVRYIFNVGSVGYPRHDFCSTYVIYDSDRRLVTYRRLPFDFKGYIEAMLEAKIDLPRWLMMLLLAASGR